MTTLNINRYGVLLAFIRISMYKGCKKNELAFCLVEDEVFNLLAGQV